MVISSTVLPFGGHALLTRSAAVDLYKISLPPRHRAPGARDPQILEGRQPHRHPPRRAASHTGITARRHCGPGATAHHIVCAVQLPRLPFHRYDAIAANDAARDAASGLRLLCVPHEEGAHDEPAATTGPQASREGA